MQLTRKLPYFLTLLTLLLVSGAAQAQQSPLDWLPPGSKVETTLSERPARAIRSEMQGGRMGYLARLGELVFRSPLTLGRDSARKGLSCDACHPNGAANTSFFVPGNSDLPGNVDVSHRAFNYREDDGLANPVNIPTLRGVRLTAPYGRDGRFADLRSFTRNVIMVEFGAKEPAPWMLDSLTAYMRELAMPPNSRISGSFSPPAWRKHCVYCHAGPADIVQGHRWDVGTGGFFEAPTLQGLAETAPYLHDGRSAALTDLIGDHFDQVVQGNISAAETEEIIVFLENFGAVDRRYDPETLDGETGRLIGFLDILRQPLLDEDAPRTGQIGDMLSMEIGRLYGRFDDNAALAKASIREWAKALKRLLGAAREGDFPAARDQLRVLQADIRTDLPGLRSQIDQSLFAATAGD